MLAFRRIGWGILISVALTACRPGVTVTPTLEPTAMPGIESVPNVDVAVLIRINSPEDVEQKRIELLEFIFGQPRLPEEMPEVDSYTPDEVTDWLMKPYQGFDVTVLTVRMPHGLVSNMVLVESDRRNNSLILYHTGHGGLTELDKKNTRKLAKEGFDLLILYMPLVGLNRPNSGNNPGTAFQTECCGSVQLGVHQHLSWTEEPLSYFLKPVAVGLNYADTRGYENYIMIGFSGGGWTTTVYTALDTRIAASFPVAGSIPLWMRIPGAEYEEGDFEVLYLELYDIANYLELYVMGAYGEGRYQDQILNFYDPCCFGGDRAEYYVPAVQGRLEELGAGKFTLWIDHRTMGHALGENGYNHILHILENEEELTP